MATVSLRDLRERRFSAGVACVRCGSARIQRWGSFSGRQRYRCLKCRRTFSDLTGTTLAYLKRDRLWGEFGACMLASLTVRAAGARLGIDKDTAWRWRHRVLEGHCRNERPPLTGIVELAETRVLAGLALEVARDRTGNTRVAIATGDHPRVEDLVAAFGSSDAPRVVLGREGIFGVGARYAAATGAEYRHVKGGDLAARDGTIEHNRNAVAYARNLRQWLARFRGVADRYLPHYLAWHFLVERWTVAAAAFVIGATPAPPARATPRGAGRRRSGRAGQATPPWIDAFISRVSRRLHQASRKGRRRGRGGRQG